MRGALAEMLDGIEMAPPQIEALVSRARDAAYWTSLAPGTTTGTPALSAGVADDERARTIGEALRRERYFKADPMFDAAALTAMNSAIDTVQAAGWPPVFALVYDSLWTWMQHPLLSRVVRGHLGENYQLIPHVWVHVVPARAGARGWRPHFDGFRSARLTVWIALTDATVDNGCVHLIPPDSLPDSFRTTDVDATVVMSDVQRAMWATRALPVDAGAVLGWEFDVFHWGGRAAAPNAERRSLSLELLAAGEAPRSDEVPLMDASGSLPSFEARLRVIAIALQSYADREASLRRYCALAPGLLA